MRAAIYVRVSHREQKTNGRSVESQIAELTKYCNNNGYTIVDVYNDAGISARKSYKKRPELQRLIKDCQQKKVDLILVTLLDRFFRSVPDYYDLMNQIGDIPWRAIFEDYDTTTSAGQFKVNIMLSISQAEADRTSEKIKIVKAYKKSIGEYQGGMAPTGYKCVNSKLVINEEQREGVQAFFDSYALYHSLSRAREDAFLKGLNIKRATARKMMDNTTYYGDAFGHKCPAYITPEQFRCNQESLSHRTRENGKAPIVAYFKGLMFCGCCGAPLVCGSGYDTTTAGNRIPKRIYECSRHKNDKRACPGAYIAQKKFERMLLNIVRDDMNKIEVDVSFEEEVASIDRQIKKLESKMERIGIRYEDGDITTDQYRMKRKEILEEIESLRRHKPTEHATLPDGWEEQYAELDGEGKAAFWSGIIKEILVYPGRCYEPHIIYR